MKYTVFQQIMKPITQKLINESVRRFNSDYNCTGLFTKTHLETMIYAHLNEIKSLRTLEVAINTQKIGIKSQIKRSTLSDANKRRPANCFFWILEQILSLLPRTLKKEVKQVVRILDSSPIQLKGRGYDTWTKEFAIQRCQGVKLHVEYDLALKGPTKVAVSHPNYNDSKMGQDWPITPETIYVFDKGYYDFNWWWSINKKNAFFVTRLKKNVAIIVEKQEKPTSEIILEDGTFTFKNKMPRGAHKNLYTENLRRISVAREGKKPLILVTNLHHLPAEVIADLYKARWEIELFFKWIKQNLKLKKFLGTSANAVLIQLASAIIAYLLVQLFKKYSEDPRSLQLVLTWIRYNLHTEAIKFKNYSPPIYQYPKQVFLNKVGVHL